MSPTLAAIGSGSLVDLVAPLLALLLVAVTLATAVIGRQQRGASLYQRLRTE